MGKKLFIMAIICLISCTGCGSLKQATSTMYSNLSGYQYAYITQTSEKIGTSEAVYGNQFGVYGSSSTKCSNPADLISGYLIKKGYIRLPEINEANADRTIIVNYGESGRRNMLFGYAIEVSIQILNAKTNSIICTCSAEGMGETEADDVRIAINRCLDKIFEQ